MRADDPGQGDAEAETAFDEPSGQASDRKCQCGAGGSEERSENHYA